MRLGEAKEVDASVKTSEYGSCEPSPTNASQGLLCSHQDSDYDNDYAVQEVKFFLASFSSTLCFYLQISFLLYCKVEENRRGFISVNLKDLGFSLMRRDRCLTFVFLKFKAFG